MQESYVVSPFLETLAAIFKSEIPQVTLLLRYSKVVKVSDLESSISHSYKVLSALAAVWTRGSHVVLYNSNAYNLVRELEVIKLVGELV